MKKYEETDEIKLWSAAISLFDPPEADKCLLAFGEFNVGRSMFDVQSFRFWTITFQIDTDFHWGISPFGFYFMAD